MAIRMSVQEAESLSTYLKTKSGELLSTMKALDSKLHQVWKRLGKAPPRKPIWPAITR